MSVILALVVAFAAVLLSASLVNAQSVRTGTAVTAGVRPADMRAGTLLLRDGETALVEAPRLGTDIDITVSGPTARARVTQMFRNPGEGWVEAIYVYPLPDGAAVDTLKMVVGERVVVGSIKERRAAKVIYEAAKQQGQKAALVEQERPNIFTTSVANIGPGETVVVQIEYQEPVRQTASEFKLRVPLVVAPRYNPRPLVQTVDFGNGGWGRVASDPVPDRHRIEPPVLDPSQHAPTNPVTISVRLDAGFPLGEVKSHHHAVKTDAPSETVRVIKLQAGAVPADRDFELTWSPAATKMPAVGLFKEKIGDADYLLGFITPPALPAQGEPPLPREVIFVIDNSGSMGGTSMVQAKTSLLYALKRLKPADRFNVIRFDNTMETVFPAAVAADSSNLAMATAFVSGLEARGGTEMLPPLKAALTDGGGTEATHLRQVIFLTDGAIGNEQQLLDTMGAMLGRSRVFMVGIGSAPNSFLMTRAAEIGRGTFTHIGSVEQVEARMRVLFEKLESPVVTNLAARFSGTGIDVTPGALPDLYRGEPLLIAAKVPTAGKPLDGTLEVTGVIGNQPWTVTLPLGGAGDGKGLSKVWARRKIADAEVARTLRQATPEETDKRILALALDHHLVSRLTSLVAVDSTPSRPEGTPLSRADVPLNLPAGWAFDKVFGTRKAPADQRAAAPAPTLKQDTALRGAQQMNRSLIPVAQPVPAVINLPKTATDAELRFIAGLILCLLGLSLALFSQRRDFPRRPRR